MAVVGYVSDFDSYLSIYTWQWLDMCLTLIAIYPYIHLYMAVVGYVSDFDSYLSIYPSIHGSGWICV